MLSLLTLPFYLVPFIFSLRKGVLYSRGIFFIYTFFGAWLYCALLESKLISPLHIIAPWILNFESIPWVTFALINFFMFILSYDLLPVIRRANTLKFYNTTLAINKNKIKLLSILCIALILMEWLITFYIYGGVANFVKASYSRVTLENNVVNLLYPLVLSCNILILIIYASCRYINLKNLQKYIFFVLLIQTMYCFLAGGRSIALLLVISSVITHYGTLKNIGFKKMVLGACLILIASSFMISKRFEMQSGGLEVGDGFSERLSASYTGLPMIDHLGLSMKYADARGFDYGEVYFNALLSYIPRAIWPEKPIQLSRKMREFLFGDISGGIPPGLFGEAYIAFGILGLIVVAIVFSFILRGLDNRIIYEKNGLISRLRLAILPTLIGFIFVRGGVDIGVHRVGIILFLYFLFETYIRKKK